MTNNPSDALRCPDCEEAARHAYSDATTPGFFNPKCPKHQADVLRAAIRKACEQIANELGAAEMLSGPCMDAARIIERHLSPVVLAAEAAAVEECAAELREWLAVNLPRIRHEAACQMLESVRGSLEAYPNGGGDIGIMEQVERIKAEATQCSLKFLDDRPAQSGGGEETSL